EGPEVAAAVLDDLASDQDARPRVLHGDLHAHVALVVLQPDVVARPVLLDEVVLEDEGFLVAGGDQGLELGQALDQEAHLAALVALHRHGASHAFLPGRVTDGAGCRAPRDDATWRSSHQPPTEATPARGTGPAGAPPDGAAAPVVRARASAFSWPAPRPISS